MLKIFYSINDETIKYAADELLKYIKKVNTTSIDIEITNRNKQENEVGISLGLLADFNLKTDEVEDFALDDVIDINITNLNGYIAGSNIRSVLLGVYRFFYLLGCRWIRPTENGEYLVKTNLLNKSIVYHHKASNRYRGECIEGAVSIENMIDNIRWAPKVGFNSYFLEFTIPFAFFNNWYSHKHNTVKKPEEFTMETAALYTDMLEKEIKKCGLNLHSAGHGWTCEPFGIDGKSWDKSQTVIVDEEMKKYFALVNGERGLFNGIPLNTNLCYSNKEARKIVAEFCAEYALKKPYVDFLHIWLADGINNHCECEECIKKDPVEFYINLMNDIDDEFERRGIDTKLVFLIYVDLLWAPKIEKLNKSNRFIMLFAPITRTYDDSYSTEEFKGTLKEYKRNQLTFPRSIPENVAYLKEWQKVFDGDCFVYEYYFMIDHYYDPGYYSIAKTINEDVKMLPKLNLSGIISDQTQRSFLPTGFPMYILAETLYDDSITLESEENYFFEASFGKNSDLVLAYMKELSTNFDPKILRNCRWEKEVAVDKLKAAKETIKRFMPVIENNQNHECECHKASWNYLTYHAEITDRYADVFILAGEGHIEEAKAKYYEFIDYISRIEDDIQDVFDLATFVLGTDFKFDDVEASETMNS